MTKKDYIKIAAVLKRHVKQITERNSDIVSDFCEMLEKDNQRFDANKFFKAVFSV